MTLFFYTLEILWGKFLIVLEAYTVPALRANVLDFEGSDVMSIQNQQESLLQIVTT